MEVGDTFFNVETTCSAGWEVKTFTSTHATGSLGENLDEGLESLDPLKTILATKFGYAIWLKLYICGNKLKHNGKGCDIVKNCEQDNTQRKIDFLKIFEFIIQGSYIYA